MKRHKSGNNMEQEGPFSLQSQHQAASDEFGGKDKHAMCAQICSSALESDHSSVIAAVSIGRRAKRVVLRVPHCSLSLSLPLSLSPQRSRQHPKTINTSVIVQTPEEKPAPAGSRWQRLVHVSNKCWEMMMLERVALVGVRVHLLLGLKVLRSVHEILYLQVRQHEGINFSLFSTAQLTFLIYRTLLWTFVSHINFPCFFRDGKGKDAAKVDKRSKRAFQSRGKGAMRTYKFPRPGARWPSLLSTCVSAMLDKFLFEFPH